MEQVLRSATEKKHRITAAAGSVSAAIMLSRILGLVREMVLARYFGAGMQADAFNIAYRIPNLLRDLFAEGALSAAFVPTFVRQLNQGGKEQAWALANRLITALLVILSAVTLAIFFGARLFVWLLAAYYAEIPGKFELTVQLTRMMSPFLLCISLASVGMGILNACGSFFVPAMASSAFNICCILAGILLSPLMPQWGLDPVVSMAAGALVGGIAQFSVMIPSAYRLGFRYRLDLNFSDPAIRHIGRLMLPAIIGLSATQINITVDSQISSTFGDGPVSYLNYGFRLMQFPIGVFGIAIATVAVSALSHYASVSDMGGLRDTIGSSVRLAACLTIPATAGLILFRMEIVSLLYEHGSFTAADTLKTSQVVLLYSLGLFSYSAVKILVPVFYALNDTATPVRTSAVTVAAKIVLNFLFIIPLGFAGLVLATTTASWLNYYLLLRQLRKKGVLTGDGKSGSYLRIVLASCVMGLFAWVVFHGSCAVWPGEGVVAKIFHLGTAVLTGVVVTFPLFRLFKVPEGDEILLKMKNVIGGIL